MKLSRFWKIAIGAATVFAVIAPFLIFPLMFVPFFFAIASESGSQSPETLPTAFAAGFVIFFIFMMLYAVLQLALQVFYLVHVIQNDPASKVLRILCGVGAFFLPFLAMPAYYMIYIWPESPSAWALEPKAGRSGR